MLRHAHDKCTRADTITSLPATVPRPDIDVQLRKVEAVVAEQGKTERAVANAGWLLEARHQSFHKSTAESAEEAFQSPSAAATQAVLERHKDELKAVRFITKFDAAKCHELVYNLMNAAGHPIAKWTTSRKQVDGARARVYTLQLDV
ncbi:hypothetical protein PAPYR_5429 [Paratrimastix pyriformis]|uniref:Uncharacterized protein n=1 Tax=Paratrimastix pyriformis TaxID=342808 RepID=A0ABQ8UKD2_9EUKA|nr:hypothetical protein PAPYR_5429 [Paratrimastix pyriformis]